MTHDEKLAMLRAMRVHGGSFVSMLSSAWLHADSDNCRRLEAAFPEYVAKYQAIAAKTKPEENQQ
jgi:hypothetical protein